VRAEVEQLFGKRRRGHAKAFVAQSGRRPALVRTQRSSEPSDIQRRMSAREDRRGISFCCAPHGAVQPPPSCALRSRERRPDLVGRGKYQPILELRLRFAWLGILRRRGRTRRKPWPGGFRLLRSGMGAGGAAEDLRGPFPSLFPGAGTCGERGRGHNRLSELLRGLAVRCKEPRPGHGSSHQPAQGRCSLWTTGG
jgi:hypothetical protein